VLQAFHVRFLSPKGGDALTWVVIAEGPGAESIDGAFVEDVRRTLLKVHQWDTITILEIRHLDRATITLGSLEGVRHILKGTDR